MRARNIKPRFFINERLAECPMSARLLFIGLWCLADREGRLEDRPKRIKAEIFPYDDCDVDPLLDDLFAHGFIERYEVDGCSVIQVNAFTKHQHPHHKEVASTLPPPPKEEDVALPQSSTNPGWVESETSTDLGKVEHRPNTNPIRLNPDSGFLIPESGYLNPDKYTPLPPKGDERFDRFWKAFPSSRKQGKEAARKAWKHAIRKADPETIIAAAAEYADSPVGKGNYAKSPASWLNQGCWEDDRTAWNRQDTQNGRPAKLLDTY